MYFAKYKTYSYRNCEINGNILSFSITFVRHKLYFVVSSANCTPIIFIVFYKFSVPNSYNQIRYATLTIEKIIL